METGTKKPQISPARHAPVEMANLFEQMNCHLDESVAEWRDLRFSSHHRRIRQPGNATRLKAIFLESEEKA